MLYKQVELKEGVPVQYLGVYVLRWRPEWGEPTVGFVEVEEDIESRSKLMEQFLRRVKSFLEMDPQPRGIGSSGLLDQLYADIVGILGDGEYVSGCPTCRADGPKKNG